MPSKHHLSKRSIRFFAHLSLLHVIPVQPHTYMSCPLSTFVIASWPNPCGGFKTSSLAPELIGEGLTFGDQAKNLVNLQTVFSNYERLKKKTFYEFVLEYTVMDDPSFDKQCGSSKPDDPQPMPDFFKFTPIPHFGVCQMECNGKVVFSSPNCQYAFDKDWKYPVNDTVREQCAGHMLVFTFIASHGDPWQSYINCVNIAGKGKDGKIPDKAKGECSYTGGNNSTSTPAPSGNNGNTNENGSPGGGEEYGPPKKGNKENKGEGDGKPKEGGKENEGENYEAPKAGEKENGEDNQGTEKKAPEPSPSDAPKPTPSDAPQSSPSDAPKGGHSSKCTIRNTRR